MKFFLVLILAVIMFSGCSSRQSLKSTVTVNEKKIDMDVGSAVTIALYPGSGHKVVINGQDIPLD